MLYNCNCPILNNIVWQVNEEPLPEGLFYLLLTGEIPTEAQVKEVSADWASRSEVPHWVQDLMQNLPRVFLSFPFFFRKNSLLS